MEKEGNGGSKLLNRRQFNAPSEGAWVKNSKFSQTSFVDDP